MLSNKKNVYVWYISRGVYITIERIVCCGKHSSSFTQNWFAYFTMAHQVITEKSLKSHHQIVSLRDWEKKGEKDKYAAERVSSMKMREIQTRKTKWMSFSVFKNWNLKYIWRVKVWLVLYWALCCFLWLLHSSSRAFFFLSFLDFYSITTTITSFLEIMEFCAFFGLNFRPMCLCKL